MKWLVNRFRYAFSGLRYGIVQDKSVRFQFVIALLVIAMGFLLEIRLDEWLWIALAITLVIVFEIFNSCIEKIVDYISLERTPQAGLIKDMAAGGVMVTSWFALFVGLMVFGPRLYALVKGIL